jgi:hypothetical protein
MEPAHIKALKRYECAIKQKGRPNRTPLLGVYGLKMYGELIAGTRPKSTNDW